MKNLIVVVMGYFSLMVFSIAEQVEKNLLRDMKPDESRPAWWIDLWYKDGVVLIGKISADDSKVNEIIKIESADGRTIERIGLKKVTLLVCDVLSTKPNTEFINSHSFEKGGKVDVYIVSRLGKTSNQWLSEFSFEVDKKYILYLSDIGLAKPGDYRICWHKNMEFGDSLKKIIEAKTLHSRIMEIK